MFNKKGLGGMAIADVIAFYAIVLLLIGVGIVFWTSKVTLLKFESSTLSASSESNADLFLINYLRTPITLKSGDIIEVSSLIGEIILAEGTERANELEKSLQEETKKAFVSLGDICFRLVIDKEREIVRYCTIQKGKFVKSEIVLPLTNGKNSKIYFSVGGR